MKFGYTFEYLTHGLLLLFLGIFIVFINFKIAILIIVIGISLLILKTGIEIDNDLNCIRKYSELFAWRYGKWYSLKEVNKIELAYSSNSSTFNSRVRTDTYHTKTYDIILYSNQGKRTELISFTNYEQGQTLLTFLGKKTDIEIRDKVDEIREEAYKRRIERRM